MKKKIMAMAGTMFLLLSLTACGSEKFTCDVCGEEKEGKKWTTVVPGKEGETVCCDECYQLIQEIMKEVEK